MDGGRVIQRMGKPEDRWEPGQSETIRITGLSALLPYVFLGILTLAACWLFVGRQGVFGVKVDWLSQHSVFPDYFRQQFYETGQLFPEFAGNLGGGQNIYHFSYYGLYSPVILISYLLPFVKMGDYLMAVSVAGIFLSAGLIYYWLGNRGFSGEIRMPAAVMYLLAGPVIFQSCHQVMFINYMPFLCMAFLGVDRYFEKGRSGLYAVGVFLMIMTSFYYSIGGMMALVFYGLFRCIEQKDGFFFPLPMITAVLMSGVLLVPTAYALLGKREGTGTMDLKSLLIPQLPLEGLVHGAYGIGLAAGVITVLLTGLTYRKWSEKLLHWGCLLVVAIPFFQWILNGGLYVRGKVLIPLLPLFCYLTAVYLEKQKRREIPFGVNIAAYFLTVCWLCVSYYGGNELDGEPFQWYLVLGESILLFICFLIYWKWDKFWLLTLPSILCLLLGGSFFYGAAGEALDWDTYARITDTETGRLVGKVLDKEQGFFRLEQGGAEEEKSANINRIWDTRQWISSVYSSAYNADYQKFQKQIFETEEPFRNELMQAASDNPLYQKLMGVKYIVKDADHENSMAAAGYEPYMSEGRLTVYRSENTAPIAYATNKVVGERDYDRLEFPYNQTALMEYAVAAGSRSKEDSWKGMIEASAVPVTIAVPETETGNLTICSQAEGTYRIRAEKRTEIACGITGKDDMDGKDRLLFLRFQVKNLRPERDVEVWLNGTRNKLSARSHIYYNGNTTFTYVAGLEAGEPDVKLTFGRGEYEISELECFVGDKSLLEDGKEPENQLYQSVFQVDRERTKGSRIQGEIQVKNTGYFITSIPYEPDFEIHVDGKRTIPEKVNRAFLGFAVSKGEHRVEIVYHAPGIREGKILSCIGVLLFFIILAAELNIRHKK